MDIEEKLKTLSLRVIEYGMFEEDYKEEKVLRRELGECLAKEEIFW